MFEPDLAHAFFFMLLVLVAGPIVAAFTTIA